MVYMSFDDKHLAENVLGVMTLKKMGVPDEEIQKMYDEQVEKDIAGCRETCINYDTEYCDTCVGDKYFRR